MGLDKNDQAFLAERLKRNGVADPVAIAKPTTPAPTAPTELLKVYVRGVPAGMPRPRARAMPVGNGKFIGSMYQPTRNEDGDLLPWYLWKQAILKTVLSRHRGARVKGPMQLDVEVFFPRPEYLMKPKAPSGKIRYLAKPDFDNTAKIIADALTEAEVWADDAQACDVCVQKFYVARGECAGAWITVKAMGDTEAEPELFPTLAVVPEKKLVHPATLLRPAGRPGPD